MKHILATAGVLMSVLVCLSLVHAEETMQVTVSILPQKVFVEKIGGDRVTVSVMVEPGANPHAYEPKPQQMVNLTKSRIYFAVGDPFENVWLKKFAAANPSMRIVHTESGIEKIPMLVHDHGAGHGEEHPADEQGHGLKDPHVWLSPPLVMLQSRNIMSALVDADPSNATVYMNHYRSFIAELTEFDLELKNTFLGMAEPREFMVFHPAWGYFAEAYGLKQVPVEVEGKEPKPADLQRLIRQAKERGVKVIFVQPQFSTSTAKVIANALGGQIVFADPLAPDWAANLREVGQRFKEALK